MPQRARVRRRSATAAPLATVLLLTLAVAGAITWVAWASAASHREAAEDALRDYAQFAAANFTDASFKALYMSSMAILSPTGAGTASMDASRVHGPEELEHAAREVSECRCVMYDPAPRYFFSYRIPDGTLRLAGDSLPAVPERLRLADSLAANFDTLSSSLARRGERPGSLHAIVDTVGGESQLYLMSFIRGARGTPDMTYGFVTSFRSYADRVLPRLVESTPLVPKSLSRGLPNDSLLSVVVRDASGRELFRSAATYDTAFAASQPLWRFYPAGPSVQLALRPEAATVLLRGGLPRSRLPLLLALLVCAGALVLVALVLSRRGQELAQLRADFTSSVSHELRTPLAQIVLFAESLVLGRMTSERARVDALGVILREARRLAHLVDNVLLFSRTERHATHVAAHPRPLAPLVRDVVASFEPLAAVRRSTVRAELDERVIAPVDAGALRQILINLLDNAVKYGPEGQCVVVSLSLDGSRAVLRVDDEGNGLTPDDCQRVWEPFVRLQSGEYSVATGSGIGLSVVRQLVALHGGTCAVTRAPSGGARFQIELPGGGVGAAADSEGGSHDLAVAR